jgi:hypothetical protein
LRALREAAGLTAKAVSALERARYAPVVVTARETLGEEAFAKAWAEGRGTYAALSTACP